MEKVKADIWMPLYIGDYLADTMHLTTEQHGAYLLLLMAYWKNGGPLPGNDSALASICRLSGDAWSNARAMLVHFFSVDSESGTWRHGRIDQELGDAAGNKERRVSKAKAAAEARWAKDAKRNAPSMPEALPGECPSPSPVLKEEVPKGTCDQQADLLGGEAKKNVVVIPYEKILDAFREKLPGFPQPRRPLDEDRRKAIRLIWTRDDRFGSVDFFSRFFGFVSQSEFLTGWKGCGFDWLLKPKNFRKVLEGNYNGGNGDA